MSAKIKTGLSWDRLKAYLCILVLVLAYFSVLPKGAYAASSMAHSSIVETNMASAGQSSFYVDFKAGASDPSGSLVITFPSGFTLASSATQGTPSTSCAGTNNMFPNATGLPGTLTASVTGQALTVGGVGALTSGTEYCVGLLAATAVTNPTTTTGLQEAVTLADGTDTATVTIYIIGSTSGNGTDQISVSATIGQTFTLTFGANTDSLGQLSSTATTVSGGVGLTVVTNASNGWGLWALDPTANNGLHSNNAGKTIAWVSPTGGNHTMSTGSEQYALGVTTSNATTQFADAGGGTGGGLSNTIWQEIADSNTATTGATVTVKELADIAGTTPEASDYADTIAIVGDGSF